MTDSVVRRIFGVYWCPRCGAQFDRDELALPFCLLCNSPIRYADGALTDAVALVLGIGAWSLLLMAARWML